MTAYQINCLENRSIIKAERGLKILNIEMGQNTVPKPIPTPTNRPQVSPEGEIMGKPTGEIAGKLEGSMPVDENLDALMSALPEQSEEFIGQPKPQDSFTQSEALSKKNELIQMWKDSYQLQQNNTQTNTTMPQTSKEFVMQQPAQTLQPGFQTPALGGNIDWGNVSNEILNFLQNTGTGNVAEGLDYLISRYVALGNQVDTQFPESDRTNQKQQLERTFSQGRRELVDGYVGRLKDTLKLSDADAARLKNNMETMLTKRLQTYQKVSEQGKPTLTGMRNQTQIKQDDHYMAAQLRSAVLEAGKQKSDFSLQELRGKDFSFGDMRQAGEFAKGYQMLYKNAGMSAERELAVDMAMVDMKMQALIRKGAVGTRMVNVLQNSAAQRHESVMDTADARIAARSKTYVANEEAPKAPFNRSLVKDIYEAILNIFERNGGDALAAIREGLALLSGKSSGEEDRTRNKKGGIIYEIDGRGYAGANRPIVHVTQIGRIRDIIMGFAIIGSFFALWYFLM